MRRLHGLIILLIASNNAQASGQDRGIDLLSQQIREAEAITSNVPGGTDGEAWLKLAHLRQDAARYRDAEQAYRKAIALLKARGSTPLADAMDGLGTMYAECGELAEAGRIERKALSIRERENDVPGMGRSHTHLALLLLAKRNLAGAESEAEAAVSLLVPDATTPSSQPIANLEPTVSPEDQMNALISFSLVRCAQADCPSAISHLRRALSIAHRNYAETSIPVGFLDFLLGFALWKSGDIHAAEEFLTAGTRELSTQLSWGHPMYVRAMKQYAAFLTQTGSAREAEDVRAKIAKFDRLPGTVDVQSLVFR